MNLVYPTCANIRNEFRVLFNARCSNLDKTFLKEFLAIPYDKALSDVAVKKCDPDKFKPLCNFLQKGVNTREKNMELLAWLIDFRPRPFSNYWRLANGKADVLSELSITESGIVEENKRETAFNQELSISEKKEHYAKQIRGAYNEDYWIEKDTEVVVEHSSSIPVNRPKKEITLEYPSGVKINVDASDFSLIAKLVRI